MAVGVIDILSAVVTAFCFYLIGAIALTVPVSRMLSTRTVMQEGFMGTVIALVIWIFTALAHWLSGVVRIHAMLLLEVLTRCLFCCRVGFLSALVV
jgi:hypothetical protein